MAVTYYATAADVQAHFPSVGLTDDLCLLGLKAAQAYIDSKMRGAGFSVPFSAAPDTPYSIAEVAAMYAAGWVVSGPALAMCGSKDIPSQAKFYLSEAKAMIDAMIEEGVIPGADDETLAMVTFMTGVTNGTRPGSRLRKFDPHRGEQKGGDSLPVADYDEQRSLGPVAGGAWDGSGFIG